MTTTITTPMSTNALLTLTQELWVLKDRQRILEALLEDNGIVVADAIDAYQPDPALTERLGEERRQLIDAVLSALQSRETD